MGAGWCKRYSKNSGTESSLQEMLTKWVDSISCENEETKWNWKWTKRRQTKWKDRPEISAPRLINPCFLHGAKWDNVILSVPDPEMKSRIPVAPPRRKRKRRLLDHHAQVYQTLSFPDFRNRCLDLGTETSMSLSSLHPLSPRSPRTPRTPRTLFGAHRRLSLDYSSDCDCSISSRTSLASIPVTDELYRKQHFLSTSGASFNMTQASLLSASCSSFKRTQNEKRRKTLRSITQKYKLTLSLPNLNHLFSKHGCGRNAVFEKRELCAFSSLPDLLRSTEDTTKETAMYTMLYGIKAEIGSHFRGKATSFSRRMKPWPRNNETQGLLRRGFQARSSSQLSVSRFASNLGDTIRERSDVICEDQEEDLTNIEGRKRPESSRGFNSDLIDDSNSKQRYGAKESLAGDDHVSSNSGQCSIPQVNKQNINVKNEDEQRIGVLVSGTAVQGPTNDLNLVAESGSSITRAGLKHTVASDEPTSTVQSQTFSIHHQRGSTVQVNGGFIDPAQAKLLSNNRRTGEACPGEKPPPDSKDNEGASHWAVNLFKGPPTAIVSGVSHCADISKESGEEPEVACRPVEFSRGRSYYDNANKENLDSNLHFKYRNLLKFKSPRYLKTFRRLSQRQSEKVGCPLFFDKHHACACLRPRGQRFQSMSALPSERPSKLNLKNGLKKSLSVSHSQQGRKIDHGHCGSHEECSHKKIEDYAMYNFNDRNNNCSKVCSSSANTSSDGNSCVSLGSGSVYNVNPCVYLANETMLCKENDSVSLVNVSVQNSECTYRQSPENDCVYLANKTIPMENNCVSLVVGLDQSNGKILVNGLVQNNAVCNVLEKEVNARSSNLTVAQNDLEKLPSDKCILSKDLSQSDGNSNLTKISVVFDKANVSTVEIPAQNTKNVATLEFNQFSETLNTERKIDDALSRRSSTSDSLCELEDAIYDMLIVSSHNHKTTEVKN